MYLNLSFYSVFYAIFNCYALYHLLVVIASPLALITQCRGYFTPLHFHSKLVNKIAPFCAIPFTIFVIPKPLVYSYTTFLLAHPRLRYSGLISSRSKDEEEEGERGECGAMASISSSSVSVDEEGMRA